MLLAKKLEPVLFVKDMLMLVKGILHY